MNDPAPLLVYSYLRYQDGISRDKQAAEKQALHPLAIAALAGGTLGLGSAAFSGRRDRDGNKDRPWIRNALIGAGLAPLLYQGWNMLGEAPEGEGSATATPPLTTEGVQSFAGSKNPAIQNAIAPFKNQYGDQAEMLETALASKNPAIQNSIRMFESGLNSSLGNR